MIPIVILASGRGSNFDAIQKAIEDGRLNATIKLVLSDQPQAPVLLKAKEKGIPTACAPVPEAQQGKSLSDRRKEHDLTLMEYFSRVNPRFIVLAGYKRIVTPTLIDAFRCDKGYSRMVNIHPSILPSFPGLQSYSQAFQYGVKVAGVTVHLVEPDVDSGPICAQETFSIADCRTLEEVEQRGLKVEHRLFPETLNWVLPEKFCLEQRSVGRFCVRPN